MWRSGSLGARARVRAAAVLSARVLAVLVGGGLARLPLERRLGGGAEAACGAAKGRLRLDAALPRKRDHREQQLADAPLELLSALGLDDLLERLSGLGGWPVAVRRSEEHTSELQSR